jgi:Protein of unknown function (DUF1571)
MLRLLICLPICLPMAPTYPAPPVVDMLPAQRVEASDPAIAFLEACLMYCDKTVHSYLVTFRKQEYIGGTLRPLEVIEVSFRDHPYSVLFRWHQGQRLCSKALYVEGENKDKSGKSQVLAYSPRLRTALPQDPEGYFAKQTSRYPMTRFGFRKTMTHVLETWKNAAAENALHVQYLGLFKVPETGGLTCHKFHRTNYARPEDDGVTELIVYIDRATLLQVGSIVYGKDGQLLGEYYWRDLKLMTFPDSQFEPGILEK